MKKADISEFYRRLAESNPEPETELEYANPYTLLVAVALSAQATDVGVNKATREPVRQGHDAAADARAWRGGPQASTSRRSACSTRRRRTSSPRRAFWSSNLAARYRATATSWRSCPAWAARPPMWSSTSRSAQPTIRGRHPYLPGRRTAPAWRPGKNPLEVESRLEKVDAGAIRHARPPLADPAWPLHLQGAHARMLALPGS